jgi:hypothetical protein
MKDMLMKKLMKSEGSEMSQPEKMGKMAALKELIQEMNALMGSDFESEDESEMMPEMSEDKMQKVSVMAPDKESLMKGLDKAEDVLEGLPGKEGMSEDEYED